MYKAGEIFREVNSSQQLIDYNIMVILSGPSTTASKQSLCQSRKGEHQINDLKNTELLNLSTLNLC